MTKHFSKYLNRGQGNFWSFYFRSEIMASTGRD